VTGLLHLVVDTASLVSLVVVRLSKAERGILRAVRSSADLGDRGYQQVPRGASLVDSKTRPESPSSSRINSLSSHNRTSLGT